jgi:hypothetical protein
MSYEYCPTESPVESGTGYFYQELRKDKSGYDIILVKRDCTTTALRHTFLPVGASKVEPIRLTGEDLSILARAQEALWM